MDSIQEIKQYDELSTKDIINYFIIMFMGLLYAYF